MTEVKATEWRAKIQLTWMSKIQLTWMEAVNSDAKRKKKLSNSSPTRCDRNADGQH
jgi:hypothetical protein